MRHALALACCLAAPAFAQDDAPAEPVPFRVRTQEFWRWWGTVAADYHAFCEPTDQPPSQEKIAAMVEKLQTALDKVIPDASWTFGPGSKAGTHTFSLSPGGDANIGFLTAYMVDQAPPTAGWEFSAYKRGGNEDFAVQVERHQFSASDFRVRTEVDEQQRKIHIEVYHPAFASMSPGRRGMVTYIMLDETVGEAWTEVWIGGIRRSTKELEKADQSFATLRQFLIDTMRKQEWDPELAPHLSRAAYALTPKRQKRYGPRTDIVAGQTANLPLIEEFGATDGKPADAFKGLGAIYVYLVLDLGSGESTEKLSARTAARHKLEDQLDKAIRSADAGMVIGGATGLRFAYVDIVLMDIAAASPVISAVLKAAKSVEYAEILGFCDASRTAVVKAR